MGAKTESRAKMQMRGSKGHQEKEGQPERHNNSNSSTVRNGKKSQRQKEAPGETNKTDSKAGIFLSMRHPCRRWGSPGKQMGLVSYLACL